MSNADSTQIPSVTLVIEWENAIDVTDEWTRRAMSSLAEDLGSASRFMSAKPRILYLYDDSAVEPGTIDAVIDEVAPLLRKIANVEVIAAPGLSYYKLKNFGIAQSKTELSVMIDSDAAPQPGWMRNLLEPFSDPQIMVVGGFTVLGTEDLLSRTMALSWVFNLAHEREKTVKRQKIHVNNCAVRTDFFNANPFPDLPTFKKQCVFWLRGLRADGHRFIRTADAMVIHAPHPGMRFLAWRAWTGGMDSDYLGFQIFSRSRFGRVGYAFRYFVRKTWRAWRNILRHGAKVGLPRWQRPVAMLIALAYYLVTLVGQLSSVTTRSFTPLPRRLTGRAEVAS